MPIEEFPPRSLLSVYAEHSPELPNKVLGHAEDIAATLAEIGVGFAQPGLAAAQSADWAAALEQQWGGEAAEPAEQHWSAAEQRLCLDDGGQLFLHAGGHVYRLQCQAGDQLTLPAGLLQWFASATPQRLLRRGEGVADGQAQASGSKLAAAFAWQDE